MKTDAEFRIVFKKKAIIKDLVRKLNDDKVKNESVVTLKELVEPRETVYSALGCRS